MTDRQLRYDGVHCSLLIEQPAERVVVLRIRGTDVGEFGDEPMRAVDSWMQGVGRIDLFVDARDVYGASIEVSGEWADWLGRRREDLRSVTMLTGSRFIRVTAEFVRHFASLEGIMRICSEPAVFDAALEEAVK